MIKDLIASCKHSNPFSFLGLHFESDKSIIRVYDPHALEVFVKLLKTEKFYKMECVDNRGFFQLKLSKKISPLDYKIKLIFKNSSIITYDAYSFKPVISDFDLYLFNEGKNLQIYNHLGSHIKVHEGVKGAAFAVWAPDAISVSVVGNFNGWDGRKHQMRVRGESGVWEIFVPHLEKGEIYKFEIRTKKGEILLKSDPYGRLFEVRPKTATIVYNDCFKWNDKNWIKNRHKYNSLSSPISIYEVHLGSWRKGLSYKELSHRLCEYVKEMGFTHIELLPVMEHPLDDSWGYQVTGYFAPTSRFGTPDDFKYFINFMHNNNIGVILDWVPAHFPKDAHGLAYFDGTHLYEHENPAKGYHPDWDTYIFNYGRNEVRNFLIANAYFWFKEFHVDGLRIDAVASMLYLDYSRKDGEWEPNIFGGKENLEAISFLKELNYICYGHFKDILTIAEESTAWPMVTKPVHLGGLGFGYKWNMGWMNDTLSYFSHDPIFRKFHHSNLTFSFFYSFSENFILVLSHDEVVHLKKSLISKMPGDKWQKFANLKLLFGYMWAHPGKKLLFMGGEIAQFQEWNFKEEIQWHLLQFPEHKAIQLFLKDLNFLYKERTELHELDCNSNGFQWIDCNDTNNSVISFIRKDKNGNYLIFIFNFTPVVRYNYKIGIPENVVYKEIFNSDSYLYNGTNVGNFGKVYSHKGSFHGFTHHLEITLPPLGFLILEKRKEGEKFPLT